MQLNFSILASSLLFKCTFCREMFRFFLFGWGSTGQNLLLPMGFSFHIAENINLIWLFSCCIIIQLMYCTIFANSIEIKFELHHVYVFSKVPVSVIKISPVGFIQKWLLIGSHFQFQCTWG